MITSQTQDFAWSPQGKEGGTDWETVGGKTSSKSWKDVALTVTAWWEKFKTGHIGEHLMIFATHRAINAAFIYLSEVILLDLGCKMKKKKKIKFGVKGMVST